MECDGKIINLTDDFNRNKLHVTAKQTVRGEAKITFFITVIA